MLNILGPSARYCDGINRRSFLKIGALSFGAATLTLSDIYRAEAQSGSSLPHKAVINIYLGGGPAHQDMWEIKTEAPREIRGEFNPIATNVNGIQICEVFPRIARIMDKCVVIRSVTGSVDRHDAIQCLTGWPHNSLQAMGGRPSIGAAIARVQGPVDPSVPPFVGLAGSTQHRPWGDPGQTGFLGANYAPFKPDGPGMANMRLNGVSTDRLGDRRTLLRSFDRMRREVDANGAVEALDASQRRALDVLTSSKLVEALDVSREPSRVRERYGDGKPYQFQFDGAPTVNDQLLIARRLVEAGVRCVTIDHSNWDTHSDNFRTLKRDLLPVLDGGLATLFRDLADRGLLETTLVVVTGEFGRTPRINKDAGRDHWGPGFTVALGGGGLKDGRVVGRTDARAEKPACDPYGPEDLSATMYHLLGIDPADEFYTPEGRPVKIVNNGRVISELL
jgi:hypothetical protein